MADENERAAEAPGPELIERIASGFMSAKQLFAAEEIKLFEKLAPGAATAAELAERCGVPVHCVRVVANAMVALELLRLEGERYALMPVSATYLSGQTSADMRPALRFFDRISYLIWARYGETVKSGHGVMTGATLSDEQNEIFVLGVQAFVTTAARQLAARVDFGAHRRVLDLSAGAGSFVVPAVLERHPHLSATLVDQPQVVEQARARFAASPLRDRVELVEGDLWFDALPAGHDAVTMAHVLHLFSPEHNVRLLRRVREQVAPGVRLYLVDYWTDPTHTEPFFAALMGGEFLVWTGEGRVYSVDEMRGLLDQAGWHFVDHCPLQGPTSLIAAAAA
ncbi:MAG TPA: methyltransferase [Polyangiaceae bacterium]|nr:methyltransferase [Polyangiaceae bacterium]